MMACKVGIAWGATSTPYSFPNHPLNSSRTGLFSDSVRRLSSERKIEIHEPVKAFPEEVTSFHTKEYVEFVEMSSKSGVGYLDYGDTPSYPGVYEASLYTVGSSLLGLDLIMSSKVDHFFNPVGGLHHARRDRAGGFCVFNDAAIAITKAIEDYHLGKVAYVDIDAHHGDGVYFGFESDPRVIVADIHEDGRYLYPGTGFARDNGSGKGEGTKMNIPLDPGSGDEAFTKAFDRALEFIKGSKPEFVFLQCGADGLANDPLTHLAYTSKAHLYATKKLQKLAHELCGGRLLAMGGGGYNKANVDSAWSAVLEGLYSL
jgi:acetoin utilization protein AcuC